MKRRNFIKGTTAGLIMSPSFFSLSARNLNSSNKNSKFYKEPAKDIPVIDSYDVIVAGAGPAGVAAAIESGRHGAKTLLTESQGCLGGTWTAGLMCYILEYQNQSGLMEEIISELTSMGANYPVERKSAYSFDIEKMKLLLERMCVDAKVDILLHTQVVEAVKDSDNHLTHIITESKSGREAWQGKLFIDCTGDGDLAARAGCSFEFGNEEGRFQPMTLIGLVSGIYMEDIKPFVNGISEQARKRFYQKIINGGYKPTTKTVGLFPVRNDLYKLVANHQYGYKGFNTRDVTEATLNARSEVHQVIEALKSHGDVWNSLHLVATAEQIGVREGRRIHGLYTITKNDLSQGTRFEDAVCHVTYVANVHSVSKSDDEEGKSYTHGIRNKGYDIPLRSLIAKDVKGLMMAGRCISGDFLAHASYRVTGYAVPMGEAAGKVAAIAAKENTLPQKVSIATIQ